MLKLLLLCVGVSLALAVHPLKYRQSKIGHDEDLSTDSDIDMAYGIPEPKPLIDIFPPANKPGEILKNTDFNKVDNALGEVLKWGSLLQNRRCALGVANKGESQLENPAWFLRYGTSFSALPTPVLIGQTSLNLFHKPVVSLDGTVGILSYDIAGTSHKVVIMWDVPADRIFSKITFNMKIYERHVTLDKSLCKHLQSDGGPLAVNQWFERTEYGIKLTATMTDNIHSKLIVWVNADGFDQNGGYDLFTQCKYNSWKVGNRCKQECYGGGSCWVDKKCNAKDNCIGRPPMRCNSKC